MPVTASVDIDVAKLRALNVAFKKFAPDLRKQMWRDISSAMKPVITDARGFVPDEPPLSRWGVEGKQPSEGRRPFPRFEPSVMRRGFKMIRSTNQRRTANGWMVQTGIRNTAAAAVIYETAGTKNPWGSPRSRSRNPYAGRQFIQAIAVQSGQPIRHHKLGVRAMIQNRYTVTREMARIIRKSEMALYRRIGERGGSLRSVA